ncbi:MAG: hypothetical protein ACKO3N_19635 [Verrucomicrobiota bacterium]
MSFLPNQPSSPPEPGEGAGWEEAAGRPDPDLHPDAVRRGRWQMLTILWTAVSAGAVVLWVREPAWLTTPGGWARLQAVRLEQWLALALLGLHAGFAGAWYRARRR